jgi:hypothetical protein
MRLKISFQIELIALYLETRKVLIFVIPSFGSR